MRITKFMAGLGLAAAITAGGCESHHERGTSGTYGYQDGGTRTSPMNTPDAGVSPGTSQGGTMRDGTNVTPPLDSQRNAPGTMQPGTLPGDVNDAGIYGDQNLRGGAGSGTGRSGTGAGRGASGTGTGGTGGTGTGTGTGGTGGGTGGGGAGGGAGGGGGGGGGG